jgi:hypothetical protein
MKYHKVRYIDEIQCAAARVVSALRRYAKARNDTGDGAFHSFHIRRGDFQYTETRVEAMDIYKNVHDIIPNGSIVYVATDERNKTFFDPIRPMYDVKFLDDFLSEVQLPDRTVNTNYYGMIDQLVVS